MSDDENGDDDTSAYVPTTTWHKETLCIDNQLVLV